MTLVFNKISLLRNNLNEGRFPSESCIECNMKRDNERKIKKQVLLIKHVEILLKTVYLHSPCLIK